MTLILSIVASSVLTDLWSKEWMTVLLSFQARLLSNVFGILILILEHNCDI